MRLNYYKFNEDVDAHTRYINGAEAISGVGKRLDRDDPNINDKTIGYCIEAEYEISGISITEAKRLLRQFGGSAWAAHIDRDGCCFETTEIKMGKNNSMVKYNKHL